MTHITRAAAAAGALLAAAGLLTAGPARAASRDIQQGNWLYLTTTRGDAPFGDTPGTLLLCDPPGGHAYAAEACRELADADGDIDRIPAAGVFCPMIFAPVTAHAYGQWNGRPVDFQETYTSTCVMRARTGHVFALDG
ncbi:serine protease [Streptomyces sp. 5-8]|uniref:Serine protease n=1 Tax=Streptomyces musisoli TaxID=2802280 RepID=A0ABS1NUE6_9ACTN|nr:MULTISPECIES: SSI family serine proteinase inhibitor [Streptomyces]MBL1103648.1 serine protease [Streptomyces musisoli]MBY8839745.1 subtilase-type protease inhibitor [Streptomyces sp. SP2-10]